MTKRVNKTVANLQTIWQQLDDASGSLYNASHSIGSMTDNEEINREMGYIDITAIDTLKNKIEEMIEQKQKQG